MGATLLVSDINKITSIDLVEFNPLNDISDKTYSLATKILDIMLEKISSKN